MDAKVAYTADGGIRESSRSAVLLVLCTSRDEERGKTDQKPTPTRHENSMGIAEFHVLLALRGFTRLTRKLWISTEKFLSPNYKYLENIVS